MLGIDVKLTSRKRVVSDQLTIPVRNGISDCRWHSLPFYERNDTALRFCRDCQQIDDSLMQFLGDEHRNSPNKQVSAGSQPLSTAGFFPLLKDWMPLASGLAFFF